MIQRFGGVKTGQGRVCIPAFTGMQPLVHGTSAASVDVNEAANNSQVVSAD
jgi:hypothetical protein